MRKPGETERSLDVLRRDGVGAGAPLLGWNAARGRELRLLLLPVGLLLLVWSNNSLNHQHASLLTIVALVAGLAPWVHDAWIGDRPFRSVPTEPGLGALATPLRWPILVVAIAATIATWIWSNDNTFRPAGVVAWIIAVVAWLVAWWPRQDDRPSRILQLPATFAARDLAVIALLTVAVLVGAFLRLHRIDDIPLNPTSDHAEKLLDITDVLNGERPIFFERNTGREPTQFYLTAGLMRVFDWPVDFTHLKIGTALVGTLAIPFVYLLARELAGRVTGLLAAMLFAIGTWPVEISRAGLRFPYAVVATAATLWLLLRWMRTQDRRDALLCGLAIGIGLYGYSPFRVVVPVVCLGIAIALVAAGNWTARRAVIVDGLLIGLTTALVFVPLGRYALEHPQMFWSRASARLTGEGDDGPVGAFLRQLPGFLTNNWHAAIGFNWRGDRTWVNAVTYVPMLDVVTGALFLAGLAMTLACIMRWRDSRAIFLILALPILGLAATLAIAYPIEVPSVNREGTLAPVIFTIAALPLATLVMRLRQVLGSWRGDIVAAPFIAVMIVSAAVLSFDRYFHEFDLQTREQVPNTTEIAQTIQGASAVGVSTEDAYVIDWPGWLDIRNIGIELGDITWGPRHNVLVDAPLPVQEAGQPLLLILNTEDAGRLAEVERTYPDAYVTTIADSPRPYIVVWVPPLDEALP